jgi:hypothetical protein
MAESVPVIVFFAALLLVLARIAREVGGQHSKEEPIEVEAALDETPVRASSSASPLKEKRASLSSETGPGGWRKSSLGVFWMASFALNLLLLVYESLQGEVPLLRIVTIPVLAWLAGDEVQYRWRAWRQAH